MLRLLLEFYMYSGLKVQIIAEGKHKKPGKIFSFSLILLIFRKEGFFIC